MLFLISPLLHLYIWLSSWSCKPE